ncbi:hypothetical protein LCGC14_3164300, partial [marine sediment metagenome]
NYSRARTKPINPNTPRQQAVRATVAFLSDRWSQTLTAVQRTAWNLYADSVTMKNKLGESIFLSGFNHYIRSNVPRKQASSPVVDDGPVVFEIPEKDPTFSTTASEATQQFTNTYDATLDWADENGAHILIYQGQPQNAQRNFFNGPWRFMAGLSGVNGAPPASPFVSAAVFAISELQRIWIYARITRADGRLSEVFRADTFCAA